MFVDIRLYFYFFVLLPVIFVCTESKDCSALSCEQGVTCVQTESGEAFCNNCTKDKAGSSCNYDNRCLDQSICLTSEDCYLQLDRNEVVKAKCRHDPCDSRPCYNDGICHQGKDGGFQCKCSSQRKGRQCEEDVNECLENPCKNNGTCWNQDGGFTCLCMAAFTGSHCEININDCADNPCLNNATCIDDVGSYLCQCPPDKAGLRCQYANLCANDPCSKGTCHSLPNENYSCDCDDGWTGVNCDEDIDECHQTKTEICEQGGKCINTPGSFYCRCPEGLTGERCEKVRDNCRPDICRNGGTCVSSREGYQCYCMPGFSGGNCEESSDCGDLDCNGGSCEFVGNQYRCVCPSNTTGRYCDHDLNGACVGASCKRQNCSGECQNGSECRNASQCQCKTGFHGRFCQFRDSCLSNPCQNDGACKPKDDVFTCECLKSYKGNLCEEIDACSQKPCSNGECASLEGGGRKCMCPLGYTGDSCETKVVSDPCTSNPCQNDGFCRRDASSDRSGEYVCQCKDGFDGARCESKSTMCSVGGRCFNDGICIDVPDGFYCRCSNRWKGKNCSVSVCDHCKCCDESGACEDVCDRTECEQKEKECGSDPYKKCQHSECSKLFQNGVCNKQCDSEECLYDGFDCKVKAMTCPEEEYCRPRYENGECNRECFNEMCLWDGTDCEQKKGKDSVQGMLIIFLPVPKAYFEQRLEQFLYDLSQQVTCSVKLVRNQDGSPAIYDANIPGYGKGVEIRLKLVYGDTLGPCFNNIDTAGNFIKKFSENKTIGDFPIYDVSTVPDPSPQGPPSVYIIIGTIFCLLFVVALVGLWMKKRRKVDKTWFPPGFFRNNKNCIRSSTDQMSSGSEKQIIEGSDSFSEESFYSATLSKSLKVDFSGEMQGSLASSQVKIPHVAQALPAPSKYNHQMNCFTNSFRPPVNIPVQDDIFSKLINEAMMNYEQTGETPLHLAARYSRADAAQKFLEDGADPNAQDHNGKTPLHTAIAADAVGVFQILLRCRTCSVNVQMKDGTTPLIYSVRLAIDGMVGDLIKAEADLNKTDDQGKTGLHWASAVNNLDAAILLLHHGGLNRDAQDDKGQTPLFLAAKEGSFNVAQLLLHNSASMDLADQLDRLPRDIAIEKKHYDIVKLLDEYLAKASQSRGQSNFSDHLLMSDASKGAKQKNKSMLSSDVEGGGRNKKKRKIEASEVAHEGAAPNQSEMFASNFRQAPHHYKSNPYSYASGCSNADGKQAYSRSMHWNKHNQMDLMPKEQLRMRSQKGGKKRQDMDKWFIGSTGSSPTDSDFTIIQSPNEASNGSPGYCNNGGVFLSPPEPEHYHHHHLMTSNDGVPRCMPASVIQRYHPNMSKISQHVQTSCGPYDEAYHDQMPFSKSNGASVTLYNVHNQPVVFQQYPTPPSQQFSPNGISSAHAGCPSSTQRENLFETPSPGAGDQWVDASIPACSETHARQQLDNLAANESSVC